MTSPSWIIDKSALARLATSGDLTVLHLDKDCDLIADVTGQRVERFRVSSRTA